MSEKNEMDKAFEKWSLATGGVLKQFTKMIAGTNATATIPEYNLPELEYYEKGISDDAAEAFDRVVRENTEKLTMFFGVLNESFSADFDLIEIQDTISKCCKAVVLAYKYAVLAIEEEDDDEISVKATDDITVCASVNFEDNSVKITVPEINISKYTITCNTKRLTPADELKELFDDMEDKDCFKIVGVFKAYMKLINKQAKRALLDAEATEMSEKQIY